MTITSWIARRLLLPACLICLTAVAASAQSGIAGVVKDSSGAVLPGVTVEAASPALIEKVRVAVTDGQGQYKITGLVPGVYSVTFTLASFSNSKREGIELVDGFTAPVNAEMKLGAVSETITVSGAAPVVDVQSLHQTTVMTREVMDAIPTGRNIQAVGILIPGTALQVGGGSALSRDVGGSGNMQQSPLTYHGSTNSVTAVDGLRMNDFEVSGQYADLFNDGSFQEVSYTTGADSAEMGQGGLRINMIPKEGGNSFRGSLFANYTGAGMVADNCHAGGPAVVGTLSACQSDALLGRGIIDGGVPKVKKVFDFNPSFGGPIMKDRLWFQGTYRRQGVDKTVVDSYYDANPDPVKYTPDYTRQALDDGWASNATIRLTGQLNPKNKLTWYFDKSNRERAHWSASATTPPEASAVQTLPMEYTQTLKYQSTLTNKLLLELGYGTYRQDYTELYQPNVCTPSSEVGPDDPSSCQKSTIYRISDQVSGKNCCAFSRETYHFAKLTDFSAKISYVTGSHNIQGGWTGSRGPRRYIENHTGDLSMRFGNGVTVNADATGFGPNQVTLQVPVFQYDGITMDSGFWANDKWTIKRATVTLGLRYDWFIGYVGASSITPNRWTPAHTFSEPEFVRQVPNWRDISPRIGVAYDLFGNGKTALKASLSRYVDAQTTGFAGNRNPVNLVNTSQSLTWTDDSRDFTIFNPDGSVQDINFNPNAPIDPNTGLPQNELSALSANSTFGTLVTSTTRVDKNLEKGYDRRGYTWEMDLGIQQEVLPRVSAGLTYFRRMLGGNGTLTDNLNVGPDAYYGPFCVTGPTDAALPGGGGQQFCGIFQPIPGGPVYTATTDNYSTFRDTVLDNLKYTGYTNYRHGFDFNIRARFKNGAVIQGGASIDRSVSDSCYTQLLGNPSSTVSPFSGKQSCDKAEVAPFLADIKLLGSYNLPWALRFSATYQRTPGPQKSATWTFNQSVANANGWTISTTPGSTANQIAAANMSINLMQGFYSYDKPLNQLDLRTARRFTFGNIRAEIQADLYNLFNSAWVFSTSGSYGSSTSAGFTPNANGWLKPTNILNSRAFKIGTQIDW